jgi:TolB-like protein/Tfp pilus assembly protein PilF
LDGSFEEIDFMKRCPECRRDYYGDTLLYCLDDGNALLEGPASVDEPATAILSEPEAVATGFPSGESPTRAQIHTTDQTAIFPSGAEAEPQENLGGLSEMHSFSAHRAAKLLAALIAAVLVLAGGFFGYRYFSLAKQIESIAVMPFVNESGNPDVEYLSDGMTETLIKTLSQLPNLSVKARSTVFSYKGKQTSPKGIGEELGVQAVLLGRVVQRGEDLKLSLELVNTQTQDVIWTEQYDRKQTDLVTLQNEIARDVSSKLKTRLSGADEAKLAKNFTQNPEAYILYLQGRFYWNKREEKDFRKAVEYFSQAIVLDPNYALAYAGLADAHALLFSFGFMHPDEAAPKVRDFANKALSLDASLAEPHTTLAYVTFAYGHDFTGAEREFKRAIELNPNYATAHQWYGELLTDLGRFDESYSEHQRAVELEPLSIPMNWDLARFYYMSRRYDESLAQHNKTIEMDPGFARTHRTLGEVYRVKKDYAAAVEERAKFYDLSGSPQNAALLRETYAKDGWTGHLRLVTSENLPLRESSWVRAKAYVDLGDKDKAFAELNKAFDEKLSSLTWLKVEPQLDPLRDDPRYKDLLKRMGLPE